MSTLAGTIAPSAPRPKLAGRVAIAIGVSVAVAAGAQLVWLAESPSSFSSDYALMTILVVLGAVANHFPVELTARFKTNAATAVHFAMVLLFPGPQAIALVGVSVLIGNATLALRRNGEGRRRRGLYDTLFNTAQMMVAAAAAATVLSGFRYPALALPPDVVGIPLAAIAMYLVNTGAVALLVGLHSRRSPVEIWRRTQRIDVASEAALYLIGFSTAIVATTSPLAPLAMVIPGGVVYLATKRAVELNEQTIRAVEAMADMVDKRDRYTAEHSRRVAANASMIAPAMGLSAEDVATIRLAARVHDLGKIALPDSVLRKEGKLTAEEFALMKEHPRHGYEILARFPQYRKGREMVLAHHERVDGRGYPRGVPGDRIPLGAQIIAVADALDAMTSDRPYRAAYPLHQAMTELRLGRGTQWSAAVVDTLDRLLKNEGHELSFANAPSMQIA